MEAVGGRFCSLVLEVMRGELLCTLEAVESELCLLEIPEVIRCVRLCMLEAVEGMLCSLEVLEVLEVLEGMRRVLLNTREAVEVSSVCWRCRR